MPSIDISDSTFARLQALATPLVDTPDDVIGKLLDSTAPLAITPAGAGLKAAAMEDEMTFAAANVPSLKFTHLQSYVVANMKKSSGVYWSTLLAEMLISCAKMGIGPKKLIDKMTAPVCSGKSTAAGYQFVPEAGVSFQQLNSDRSFEQIYLLAKLGQIPFSVTWRWGYDAKASHPGKMGTCSFQGS